MAISLLAILVLVACGIDGDDSADPTATIAVEPTDPAAVTTTPSVTLDDIVWTSAVAGEGGAPVDELTSLPNNAEQVVAAVHAGTLPEGVTLQAHWTIDGETLTGLEPEPLATDEARTDAWIAWTLTWTSDQPWPIGRLGIVIEVNGKVQASDEIFIVRAREE